MVLHTTYVLRVQYSCGAELVFWFWREKVFGIMYVLSVMYKLVVQLCQFFWLWQEIVLEMEHVSTKKSYWVTLL